jgi:S23 ribosomal protein.
LEERTLKFAKEVIGFVKRLPRSIANAEIAKQLIRSSGSIGANYIEANESLSKKDFLMRIMRWSPKFGQLVKSGFCP